MKIINNIYNLSHTCWILGTEYLKFVYSNDKNQFILNISERLSNINRIYVKFIQAVSSDQHELNDEIKNKLISYTDHVPYTEKDIDKKFINVLWENNLNLIDSNNFTPINSGLVALIYKAIDEEGIEYAVKV